jgi:nucleotide-binding universal stress UspA family protein
VNIARHTGAILRLVHVQVPPTAFYIEGLQVADSSAVSARAEGARAYLESVRARLVSESDLAITCVVSDRPIVGAIADQAIVTGADLLILAIHGQEGLARLWLGTVTDALVRWSRVPILFQPLRTKVPNMAHVQPFRQMMILLDGSALAEQILGPAVALGAVMRAEFTLLHVVEPFRLVGSTQLANTSRLSMAAVAKQQLEAQAYLDRVARSFQTHGLCVRTRVIIAPEPASAILQAARQHQIDLIAMTTHGRGGLAHLLLGSVAARVFHNGGLPVLLYQPQVRRGKVERDEGLALQNVIVRETGGSPEIQDWPRLVLR